MTQFILEQQELKLKKNSKSRKKRKQNSDDEEGKSFVHILALQSKILLWEHWILCYPHLYKLICLAEYTVQYVGEGVLKMFFYFLQKLPVEGPLWQGWKIQGCLSVEYMLMFFQTQWMGFTEKLSWKKYVGWEFSKAVYEHNGQHCDSY